jgi:hypothetical protein
LTKVPNEKASIFVFINKDKQLMKFKITGALLLCFALCSGKGVDTPDSSNHKVELSLNITTSLSNFLGNSSTSTLLADPYLIGLKFRVSPKYFIRSAFNIRSKNVVENFGQRRVTESSYLMRLGLEKRFNVSPRIMVYTGLDFTGAYLYSDVTTDDFISRTQIRSNTTGAGGGPVVGLMLALNKRIALSTEAALYYQFLVTKRYMNLGFPDPTPITSTDYGYTLLPVIPSSIYVIIKF